MTRDEITERLEHLRAAIRAECISYGEIAELQGLAEHIEPGDVELLEWAGVPESPEDEEASQPGDAADAVHVATMDTSGFDFTAVGRTRGEAIAGLIDVMRAHRRQYGVETWHPGYYPGAVDQFGAEYPTDDAVWLTWLALEWYGARVVELTMGHGARDGEAIS